MHPVLACLQTTVAKHVTDQVLRENLANGLFDRVATTTIDPRNYSEAISYSKDNAVISLLKKCSGLLSDEADLHQKAVETFYSCERVNAQTNARLSRFIRNGPFEAADMRVIHFIDEWRKEIARVLGPLPRSLGPRFSNGATYHDRGRLTTLPDKLTSVPGATRACVDLFYAFPNAWTELIYRERRPRFEEVRGNRFTSVPKDSFKNRGICVEPLANVVLQLDIGHHMKKRLLKVGIDLEHGQQLHRDLAQLASLSGELATVDLSNASDTVSKNLVKLLLPSLWYDVLSTLRSPYTFIEGKWVLLEKFSSMGNGFTFELETLIFHTLCTTLGVESKVYGDDIIIPTGSYDGVVAALKFFGFEPNLKKSFKDGPFRESCGGDFFNGWPTRGPYMKKLPEEPQDWIGLHNALVRFEENAPNIFDDLRRLCIESVPLPIQKCIGPPELGDICFHLDEMEIKYRLPKFRKKWQRSFHLLPHVRTYKPVSGSIQWKHWSPSVRLVSALAGGDPHRVVPRDYITGYVLGWTHVAGIDGILPSINQPAPRSR